MKSLKNLCCTPVCHDQRYSIGRIIKIFSINQQVKASSKMLNDLQKNLVNLVLFHCLMQLLGPALTDFLVKLGVFPPSSRSNPDPHTALVELIDRSKKGELMFPKGTATLCQQTNKLFASKGSRAEVCHASQARWDKYDLFLHQWTKLCSSLNNVATGAKIKRLHELLKAEIARLSQPGASAGAGTTALLLEMAQTSFEKDPEDLNDMLSKMSIRPTSGTPHHHLRPRQPPPQSQKTARRAANTNKAPRATSSSAPVAGPYRPTSTFPPRKVPY